jgi:hypothetical protein
MKRYGARLGQASSSFGSWSILITLRGIYNLPRIAELYAALPGVTAANANYGLGDGPTLCAARTGQQYQYIVDRAGGDCPAGCTTHDMRAFRSDAAGQITPLGSWSSNSGDAAPAWAGICSN